MAELIPSLEKIFSKWHDKKPQAKPQLLPKEVGTVLSVGSGIARVRGLAGAFYEEIVFFKSGIKGLIFDLTEDDLGIIILGDSTQIEAGTEVERTEQVMSVPVGEHLIGRVLNALAAPLDNKGPIYSKLFFPLERKAPSILDRSPVTTPLQTGIKVIDALIPIGRGQRELILGDRQIGKSAIALDTILNQKNQNVICIYCTVGQRSASVAKAIQKLRDKGAMEYTIVIVAEGSDPPGLRYLAPYSATSIAEYFMEQGRDVLIVYDDLTNHARAYRELSLLMRRPPGREAFPGDIFYIHSRLLERSTHLREELGGGSLTALPIIETEAEDMSAYIPTNLISITDGQLYLSPSLFEKGVMPAIDIGKSVSRVGGKAQIPAYHAVTGSLKLAFSQFEELEMFARFGTRLDEHTRRIITHGQRIRECLIQKQYDPFDVLEQMMVLLLLTEGLLDAVPLNKIKQAETILRQHALTIPKEIRNHILMGKPLDGKERMTILSIGRDVLIPLKGSDDSDK